MAEAGLNAASRRGQPFLEITPIERREIVDGCIAVSQKQSFFDESVSHDLRELERVFYEIFQRESMYKVNHIITLKKVLVLFSLFMPDDPSPRNHR
jgi:hypothetical protein